MKQRRTMQQPAGCGKVTAIPIVSKLAETPLTPLYMKANSLIAAAMFIVLGGSSPIHAQTPSKPILDSTSFAPLIDSFATTDDGKFPAIIDSHSIPGWMQKNVPLFECPVAHLQEIYYFRWYSYLKHIEKTPDGYVITEFLPQVRWAGKDNTISCAAGHHIYEGRWIRDPEYLDDYSRFWFRHGGAPRSYSFWAADAVWARYLATGNSAVALDLLPDLVKNYEGWEKTNYNESAHLFWQIDDRDGMEWSLSGNGFRPSINSYMYGDAMAISQIAKLAGNSTLSQEYAAKADALKKQVEQSLWNPADQFFETLSPTANAWKPKGRPPYVFTVGPDSKLRPVREQIGFVPWYFNLPDATGGYEAAWKQLMDPQGFSAPFGPTSVERRNPQFMAPHRHDCLWNGPAWPFATTQTLVAMANLLDNYSQNVVSKDDYLTLLTGYANSQYRNGKPWVAEDLDGLTGKWIVDLPRSVYYNHSGYADLIITGLVGLRPRADDEVDIRPLAPVSWDYFCLQDVPYHGHLLTILFDKTGQHYHQGIGLRVLSDGREFIHADTLRNVTGTLPKN